MYIAQGVLFGILFGIPAALSASLSFQRSSAYGAEAGLISGLGGAFASSLYGIAAIAAAEAGAAWFAPHPSAALAATVLALAIAGGWRFAHSWDTPGEESEQGTRGWLFFSAAAVSLSYPSTFLLYFLGALSLRALPIEGALSWFQLAAGILVGAFFWQALLTILPFRPWGRRFLSPLQVQRALAVLLLFSAAAVVGLETWNSPVSHPPRRISVRLLRSFPFKPHGPDTQWGIPDWRFWALLHINRGSSTALLKAGPTGKLLHRFCL